jgi:hypothetical protein
MTTSTKTMKVTMISATATAIMSRMMVNHYQKHNSDSRYCDYENKQNQHYQSHNVDDNENHQDYNTINTMITMKITITTSTTETHNV